MTFNNAFSLQEGAYLSLQDQHALVSARGLAAVADGAARSEAAAEEGRRRKMRR